MNPLHETTRTGRYPTLANARNRALRIHAYGGAESVLIDHVDTPSLASNEVLVWVHAAGINGLDWKIRDGILQDVFRLPLPATLGIELAGEVIGTGADVTQFAIGDRVMGALGGLGAYADRVAIAADKLARVPSGLSDTVAAAIPVAALTAWQALFEAGELKQGQTVLIHGASGGVGGFAVQLAHRAGARVLATARAANADYLRGLGADDVIDYRTVSFWEKFRDVDLALDFVGGDALANSWRVLSVDGRIVSTAAPEITAQTPPGKRGVWFQMRVDAKRLAELAEEVAHGDLQATVSEIVEPGDAAAAIERNKTGHGPGKTVIKFR